MNTEVLRHGIAQIAQNIKPGKPLGVAAILSLFLAGETASEVLKVSLVDAYLQVSVFVAGTLGVLFLFDQMGSRTLESFLRANRGKQVLIAATLGVLPGCGGAIMVTTQYVRGSMSFGGVVAVLVATMGDAAFLLLAKEPAIAALVFATCYSAGIATGYLVNLVHGTRFLEVPFGSRDVEEELIVENQLLSPLYRIWMAFFVPGAIAGIMLAFQLDPAALSQRFLGVDLITPLAVLAAVLSLLMWMLNPISDFRLFTSCERSLERRVCDTTNFVTFWVIVGFVGYALAADVFALDIKSLFDAWTPLLPLIALLVGFIPGCGPQIVVTTMYLNGLLPLSALMANAISNDGDALFPAIVAAPKAAIIATLYSAVPALIIGYGVFFAFE